MAETGWVKAVRQTKKRRSVQEEIAIKRHVAEEARKINEILHGRSMYQSAAVRR